MLVGGGLWAAAGHPLPQGTLCGQLHPAEGAEQWGWISGDGSVVMEQWGWSSGDELVVMEKW